MAQKVTSWEILNTIRTEASPLYQSQIPQATKDNIAQVGEIIFAYEPLVNEFTQLVGKIAMTITKNRVFNNKLAVFKKGMVETGDTIEEYILGKITSKVQWKPVKDGGGAIASPNPFEVMLPKVKTAYHRENRSETYGATISFKHMRKAFRTPDGVYKMIEDIVSQIYTSAQIDEYNVMKEVIGSLTDTAHVYISPKLAGDDVENTKAFVKIVKKALNDMEEPTSDFHRIPDEDDGEDFLTWINRDEVVLLLNKDIEPEIEVEVLAKAFNRGDVTLGVKQIIVGDFGENGNIGNTGSYDIYAILLDPYTLQFYDTYFTMKSQENARGDYINYFLHVDQILGLSPFTSVALIVTDGVEPEPTPEP